MILVIIIAAAWIVILAPSLMKRRSQSVGEIGSISHFHRQLRVLEHSGPEPIVAPAYRLRSVDGGAPATQASGRPEAGAAPVLSVVGASQLPKPALAFLGEQPGDDRNEQPPIGPRGRQRIVFGDVRQDDEWTARPVAGARPAAVGGMAALERMSSAEARFRVRKRRRDALVVLVAVFVTTLAIGFVPGATLVWVLTALCGVALAAYVTLLVRLRQQAEERERKLHYLRPEGSEGWESDSAARARVPMGGRYAHPSNPAFAAH